MSGSPDRSPSQGRSGVIGIDIGGTTTSLGLLPEGGGAPLFLRHFRTRDDGETGRGSAPATPPASAPGGTTASGEIGDSPRGAPGGTEEGDAIVERILRAAHQIRSEVERKGWRCIGVGVGVPGVLSREDGRVRLAPNLGWVDVSLRARLQEGLSLPVHVENDADCTALGEWAGEDGGRSGDLVLLVLGTGVGGGLVLGGRIHRGESGVAGEIGHTPVEPEGRRCGCGRRGCLEAYVSGPSIVRRTVEAMEAGADSLLRTFDGRSGEITAATVSEAAREGDPLARRMIEETGYWLGISVATLLNLLSPREIVIAGGVASAGEPLFAAVRSEVGRRAFADAIDACIIRPATFPETAGVIGAAEAFRSAR